MLNSWLISIHLPDARLLVDSMTIKFPPTVLGDRSSTLTKPSAGHACDYLDSLRRTRA